MIKASAALMPIRITETEDGRFTVEIDSDQFVTITYEIGGRANGHSHR